MIIPAIIISEKTSKNRANVDKMRYAAIATTPINNIQAIIRKVCKRLITLIFSSFR